MLLPFYFATDFWTPKRKNAKVRHQMVELANQTIVDHLVIHRGIRRISKRTKKG